ncbi:MAG: NAD(P)H-dependent oxidoreductase subunit E, partial [Armatimonadota bacterium]
MMQKHKSPHVDLVFVDSLVARLGRSEAATIPILQAIQSEYRYLPEEVLRRVCELTEITPASIVGVASFFSQFRHRPVGRHMISVCQGTACYVKGADLVYDAIRRELGLAGDDDTDAGDVFTLQKVSCLGCCTLAPAIQVDGVTYGHVTPDTVHNALRDFLELERRGAVEERFEPGLQRGNKLGEIRIGMGSCCIAGGSSDVRTALENSVREIGAPAVVKTVGCVGMCHQTPLVEIIASGRPPSVYAKVDPNDAPKLVRQHFKPRGIIRRIKTSFSTAIDSLLTDESWEPVTRYSIDMRDAPICAFVGRQEHIATEHCGDLDPLDLDEYIEHDGFAALRACVQQGKPEWVIDTVKQSGLRGRGGAGFPTAEKWATVCANASDVKYVICNGDEGDPGAFMDRMMLESYPYRVIEGMAIAAFAV